MREEAPASSLPSDADSLRKVIADCEATDHDLRARLVDIRALRLVVKQARDPRFQSAEARAHLCREVERLRASLARPGVISSTIRSYLSIPSPESFPDPAEFFRLVLQRVTELHAAASRRLVEVQAASAGAGPAATPDRNNPNNPPQRPRRTSRLSRIQKAIVILQYRAKKKCDSMRVEEIAREAGCSAQNLYDSPEFQRALEIARNRHIRHGWKCDGVADALDDST